MCVCVRAVCRLMTAYSIITIGPFYLYDTSKNDMIQVVSHNDSGSAIAPATGRQIKRSFINFIIYRTFIRRRTEINEHNNR